jgi:hypothetical protein
LKKQRRAWKGSARRFMRRRSKRCRTPAVGEDVPAFLATDANQKADGPRRIHWRPIPLNERLQAGILASSSTPSGRKSGPPDLTPFGLPIRFAACPYFCNGRIKRYI